MIVHQEKGVTLLNICLHYFRSIRLHHRVSSAVSAKVADSESEYFIPMAFRSHPVGQS
jgi:hypothetical protein